MPLADIIAEKLRLEFAPQRLAVHDDSARHAGHAGARPAGVSHVRVEIVATGFEGKSRLDRQRQIHALLAEELAGPIHALEIQARAPSEI